LWYYIDTKERAGWKMKKITGKNDVCREHLLSEIAVGVYRPGERLPAERELSENYQVSRSTVRTALNELEEQGVVCRRPPVGTFVSDEALKRLDQLGRRPVRLHALFVMSTSQIDNPFLQRLFLALKNRLPEGVELTVCLSDTISDFRFREKPDMVYLFGNYDDEELLAAAAEIPHPVIWGRSHETLNFVTCDDYLGGTLMAEAALKAGHRHLALLGPRGSGPDCEFSLRAAGIVDACKKAGAKLLIHRMTLEESLDLTASTFFAMENFLRADPKLSMVLALRDREAITVIDCCRRRNLAVPQDISVIGYDDQCFVESVSPPLTTIRCAAEEIGARLAGFAQAVLNAKPGEPVRIREAIRPFLVERRSVRTLSPAR